MPYEENLIWLVLAAVFAVVTLLAFWFVRRRAAKPRLLETTPEEKTLPSVTPAPQGKTLSGALEKTRTHWWSGFSQWVSRNPSELQQSEWDTLEEVLLTADVSVSASTRLLQDVRGQAQKGGPDLGSLLKTEVERVLSSVETGWTLPSAPRPFVISIVGVNGVGKTTTAGKLAFRLSQSGHGVLLAACDTFRAAAIEQLRVWSERAGCQFVAGREAADPGATAFDALTAAKARGLDVVVLDTAGRLHTKAHLMDELKRVHRVVKKVIPEAPHQVWLVVDGTLGQNSVAQAKQFHEDLGVTGVIITKLDGTARGGSVLSIASDLKIPVRFVGVGEAAEDLVPFEPGVFADALLAH